MALRNWQKECASTAIKKYFTGQNHFLCLATPGAGKTRMAAEVAKQLFALDKIDFVICFSPSVATAKGMQSTLELFLQVPLTGRLGAKGACVTYQSLIHKDNGFWELFRTNRVFAIFDEIHHCGGNDVEGANVWAQQILLNVQSYASYTLALSGTPWRSDKRPVTLSKYHDADGSILCDYEYGLVEAIQENVCRIPHVTVIDNDNIIFSSAKDEPESYKSIRHVLQNESISYQAIVEAEPVIDYCLKEANKQLKSIKLSNPQAAGLVVASTVEHAEKIAERLRNGYSKSVSVVTYRNTESDVIIDKFQQCNTEWLVSVGMVSEGTNIPRLQVCCHLTRIKTELHFRQILGRVMRLTSIDINKHAHLFAPAQPRLVEYAERLYDDIPVEITSMTLLTNEAPINVAEAIQNVSNITFEEEIRKLLPPFESAIEINDQPETPSLTETYLNGLGFAGRFTKNKIVSV